MGKVIANLELINENIWDLHPTLSVAGPIKELYTLDKSKNKTKSSKLMWTIVLIWDRDSKYFNLPELGEDSKVTLLFSDVYGDEKYYIKNKVKIDNIRDFFLKLQETRARRSLREIESKLEERSRFLKDTAYDLGVCNERGQWVGNTSTIIDKMLADTKKVYDLYDAALKTVSNEINDAEAKGGAQESLSDKGEI